MIRIMGGDRFEGEHFIWCPVRLRLDREGRNSEKSRQLSKMRSHQEEAIKKLKKIQIKEREKSIK